METNNTAAYTTETINPNSIPAGAQAIHIGPEQYAQAPEAFKQSLPPDVRAQMEAAAAAQGANQIPPNPNHDTVSAPAPKVDDWKNYIGMAREEFDKLPWAERRQVRKAADQVVGRKWYQFYDINFTSQNDWAMIIAGVILGVMFVGGTLIVIGMFKKEA